MSAPEPIATGNLQKTPLPHLLVYLDQKRMSGTLAVWPDPEGDTTDGKPDRILLLKGCPMAGKLITPATTLREGLLRLFARTSAPYAFYETNLLGDDRISGRVDPISLITEALRSAARDDVVQELLQRLGDTKLRMQQGVELGRYDFDAQERGVVELLQAEPAPWGELVAGSGLPTARARRLVYLLTITKAAVPYADDKNPAQTVQARAPDPPEARPAAAAPPPPPAANGKSAPPPAAATPGTPPPLDDANTGTSGAGPSLHSRLDRLQSIPPPPDGMAPELSQRWLKVVAKGRLVENQNYFEMLELDKEAKSGDARTKFYQLAKEWHPDRLPSELQSLREYVQIIFSYMSEASATLGDEGQRIKYLQSVREGGGTPATDRMMQTILDTAMEYERVLVMGRKHEYDDAIELMKKILAVVKDDAEYHAMYVSLLMQKFPGQGGEAPLAKMLESIERALELHARHEKANMLKGQILRRMGRQKEALEWFRKAAEINPRNIDAMREVRVAGMRADSLAPGPRAKGGKGKGKGKKEEPPSVGGLIGKFFKKP
jgi:curved DNA-binding protein CbpA